MTEATPAVPQDAKRILVVDDTEEVRRLVVHSLEREGFRVDEAADGEAALESFAAHAPDLVVLDLNLPRLDGLEVLRRLRKASDTPVIVLSGRDEEADRVIGLEIGADDYVVKPFSARELVARVRAHLRRSATTAPISERLEFGDLVIDVGEREVRVAGAVVDLRQKEFDLLAHLAGAPRRVFSREQLLRAVWESSTEWQDPSTVTEHVRRVRLKLEADPENPRWVRTVRGVGYRFEP